MEAASHATSNMSLETARSDWYKMRDLLFNRHPGDLYAAYEEDPTLFAKEFPSYTGISFAGDLKLTDKQAKVIFPYYGMDTHFDLNKFPNLTSKSLKYLPKQVVCLSLSAKTDYKHMKYLTRLEKLESLFLRCYSSDNEQDLKFLAQTKLKRLEMICRSDLSFPLVETLPPTLTTLSFYNGSFDDNNLSNYLQVANVKFLSLRHIPTLTAEAFLQVRNTQLDTLEVSSCPNVDKGRFNELVSTITKASHLTGEEEKEIIKRYYEVVKDGNS